MIAKIFETHGHYDDEAFDEDRDELLSSFKKHNVEYVINSGADFSGCVDTVALCEKYDFIYGSLGIHPELAASYDFATAEYIREQAEGNKKIIAIGEIGLDYHYDDVSKQVQKDTFVSQLDMAVELKLPVVIHSREAAMDTLDILKGYKNKGLIGSIHCFSYSVEMAREFVKLGYYLGIGGVVTFKNAKNIVEVVEEIPIERLLLETDSPYLAPVPFRGKRNSALNLHYVAQRIAAIKDMEYDKVISITNSNAKKLFGLK